MSILLYCIGALSLVAGAVMAGFGIPVSEFSFGNTLIMAGVMSVVGGLVIIGLGAVVSQLQQIVAAGHGLGSEPSRRPLDTFESQPVRAASGRIPFPPKPKLEPVREPQPATGAFAATVPPEEPFASFAPNLPNPDEPPVTVAEHATLSPQHPGGHSESVDFDGPHNEPAAEAQETKSLEEAWRSPEPTPEKRGSFGFMWPSDRKKDKAAPVKDGQPEASKAEPAPTEFAPALTDAPVQPLPADEARSATVLKSGVVDGMGYTLYVDGSIEAELPQGTLRFASINELREHLAQNT